jgi:hypothetical protein
MQFFKNVELEIKQTKKFYLHWIKLRGRAQREAEAEGERQRLRFFVKSNSQTPACSSPPGG